MRSSFSSSGLIVVAAAIASSGTSPASAQERRAPAVQPANPSAPPPSAEVAQVTPASTIPMPVPEELLQVRSGGITADQVGRRAADTSFAAKQSLELMRAAEGRVDQAWAAFLPRLAATARYTHLSNFTPPPLSTGPADIFTVVTPNPGAPGTGVLPGNSTLIAAPNQSISFPLILDNYLLQASLTIPISDYFVKTNEAYSAATHSAEATRFDLGAAKATALSNGKVAYYTWMQARGAVIVAVQALNDQRTHLNDAKNQFTVGNASRADVLRAETSVANAELAVVIAKNSADLAETQMRIALHAPNGDRLVPGEGLEANPQPYQGSLANLVQEGLTNRFEVKSVDQNSLAARRQASLARGNGLPAVSAFADGIYGNPNPRYFPASQTWFPTWDVGLQATWSPNDTIAFGASGRDFDARANALQAQQQVVREGIEVEITQSYQGVKQYEFAIDSTRRALASATEAYRVARELFNNGRGTSTTLTDAEVELTRARIDSLNAAVNARIARVRLEHAVGRDLKLVAVAP